MAQILSRRMSSEFQSIGMDLQLFSVYYPVDCLRGNGFAAPTMWYIYPNCCKRLVRQLIYPNELNSFIEPQTDLI